MVRGSADPYGSQGSVPDAVPVDGSGARPFSVQATPADMGSAIGKGVSSIGEASEKLAKQYGDMVNETLLTNADAALAKRIGELKGAYLQNTGLSAAAAFPKYQADIEGARQELRAGLPLGAAHGFDMLSMRTVANHMADGSTYAASQIRQANIDSGTGLSNANVQAVLDPDIAKDSERVQWHQDSAVHGLQMTLDETHPGLKTDPKTGEINFDESTQAGRDLKGQYQNGVDNIIAQTQMNRFNTLAKGDVLGAFGIYKQERDALPKSAQVSLDAMFAPKVFRANVNNDSSSVIVHSEQEYAKKLYNPAADSALDTVQKNEGGMSGDGQSAYGIDKVAHPEEFAKISSMPESDRAAYARKFFKEEYYDKRGIADLPVNTQNIVMDGVVNHTTEFGNKLIQAAKDGETPEQLIAMRREEYQRVAQIPGKEQYLGGWNSRLDSLQSGLKLEGVPKSYATNLDGSKMSQADYYRTHSQDVIDRADALSEQQMPGDLAYKRAMRETVNNYMSKVISNQSAQYTMDNKNVMRGINGELTKGNPPATEDELRAIPGMGDLLDRVAAQDPKFTEGIPTMISKVARRNDTANSKNGYDTILRTLDNMDNPNRIANQDHLARLLGQQEGVGINLKDYNDAKPLLEADQTFKDALSKSMKEITVANGNIDGKGQERALQWFHQVMDAKKANDAKGDAKLSDAEFIKDINEKLHPSPPSRMQQISNWIHGVNNQQMVPVISPDGQAGSIPAANLEKALAAGYKKAI